MVSGCSLSSDEQGSRRTTLDGRSRPNQNSRLCSSELFFHEPVSGGLHPFRGQPFIVRFLMMMFLLMPDGKEGDEAQRDRKETSGPPSFERSQPSQRYKGYRQQINQFSQVARNDRAGEKLAYAKCRDKSIRPVLLSRNYVRWLQTISGRHGPNVSWLTTGSKNATRRS